MRDLKDYNTIDDLIRGVSADPELKDHSYDAMPPFDPEAYDPAEDGENIGIKESIRQEFQDRYDYKILHEDELLAERQAFYEASASPKVIFVADFLNSHSPEEQTYQTYVAEGYESQMPCGNAKNFASFKCAAKKAGLISNNGAGGGNTFDIAINSDEDIAQKAGLVQRELTPEEQEAIDIMTDIQKNKVDTEKDYTPAYTGAQKFAKMEHMMRSFITGRCIPLNVIAGAPGVGKTYTINKVIAEYCGAGKDEEIKKHPIAIPNSKDRLAWVSGTTKGGTSGPLLEFFKFRNHYAVIYNDCDKLLVPGKDGANVVKAVFESDAKNRYTSVPPSLGGGKKGEITLMYKNEQKGLDENVESENQGKFIGVDIRALKEDAILTVTCDGKVIQDEPLPIKEAVEVLKTFGEKPNFKFLKESWASELKESVFDDINPDSTDDDIDTENVADADGSDLINDDFVDYTEENGVRGFLFQSRFLFITNLHSSDIDEAIRDRAGASFYDIVLTPKEYLERLATVKDKIKCNDGNNDPTIEKVARDVVYKLIKVFINTAGTGATFGGKKIQIARDRLTFRVFDSAVTEYCREVDIVLGNPAFGLSSLEDVQQDRMFKRTYCDFLENLLSGQEVRE